MPNDNKTYWLVSADMGYGHQRAVYPLRDIAEGGEVITVGTLQQNSEDEQKLWERIQHLYEFFSRASSIPIIGKTIFGMLDSLLLIPNYYPMRNLSKPTLQSRMLTMNIKKGLGAGFLEKIRLKHIPVITSFYIPAIAADMNDYDQIYCIVCDADLNRVWVAEAPWESRITYFAPCGKAAQRLRAYGVPDSRIFITGFPISDRLLGGTELTILKKDIAQRLSNLDPKKRFHNRHLKSIEHFLGIEALDIKPVDYITIMYAVGGAGAQKEIGIKIAIALKDKIISGKIRLVLSAGIKSKVNDYYQHFIEINFRNCSSISVLYSNDLNEYFKLFDDMIRTTDILWTKPSELSFYTALGLPIIMAPAIGSQEQYNKIWLQELAAGIKQLEPEYTDQWLFDHLEQGRLAEAAWAGFLKARKLGIYKIKEVLETGTINYSDSPLER